MRYELLTYDPGFCTVFDSFLWTATPYDAPTRIHARAIVGMLNLEERMRKISPGAAEFVRMELESKLGVTL